MKNDKCPIQQGVGVKLAGVVCVPDTTPLNSDVLSKWITSSFKETRFQNVLKRAKVRSQASWFWHHNNCTQFSEAAIAIIADNINDYGQILIKRYQLASAVKELEPTSELLLLITPDGTYVFGMVLKNQSEFSTNILLTHKEKESGHKWESRGTQELLKSKSLLMQGVTV